MARRVPLIEFPAERLDWDRLFPVRRPVQVEIGAGKGKFLIRAATTDRASNWVGLERRWSTLALGVERISNSGLDNALYVRGDALEIVRLRIPPGSVAAFHIYYPDPWWKKRHRKRRVFSPAFVGDIARGLERGGELRVATDVSEYFDEILSTVTASGLFAPIELPEQIWAPEGEPLTLYEAKYLKQGRKPHRAAFRRGAAPAPPPEPWVSRRPMGAPLATRLLDSRFKP